MRICLIYDCLYPYTVGGAERWMRALAERLAEAGHEVTYLTLRQWNGDIGDAVPGVTVIAVGPRMALYTTSGRRRVLPPIVFGATVLWHLLRHGRRYDVVHTCSFPYFPLLAAAAVRRRRYRIVVDWFEVWSRTYWRNYLGGIGGRIGELVQRRCIRLRQHAFCFSRVHARRLLDEGLQSEPEILGGIYGSAHEAAMPPRDAEALVVFAGRHIPEKRAPAVVEAIAAARAELPQLRGIVFGDGPEREAVLAAIAEHDLADAVEAPGFVAAGLIEDSLRQALCMVLPSQREGYGLIVIESAAVGTPSVVVRGDDNAAVELIDDGVNGVIAESASAMDLAAAIQRVHDAGPALRISTACWFADHAERLSIEGSLDTVVSAYRAR
jgi:glycosyltransferase involved in cell wall biosynthesis